MRLFRTLSLAILLAAASITWAQDGAELPPPLTAAAASTEAPEFSDSAREQILDARTAAAAARELSTTYAARKATLERTLAELTQGYESLCAEYERVQKEGGPPPLEREDVMARMDSLKEMIEAGRDESLEDAQRRERDAQSKSLARTRTSARKLAARYEMWRAAAKDEVAPEAWPTQGQRWIALETVHRDALDILLREQLGAGAQLDQCRSLTAQIHAARVATRVLLARENLFLRGESAMTVDAVSEGIADLAHLPEWAVDAAATATAYLTVPEHITEFGIFVAACLIAIPAMLYLRRRTKLRIRPPAELTEDYQRTTDFLYALGVVFLSAACLAFVPVLAGLMLAGRDTGTANAALGLGLVLGGAWFVRGCAFRLLPEDGSWSPMRVDHRDAAVARTGIRLLVWGTLLIVPAAIALAQLGYENVGARQALWMVYKVFALLVVLLFLLRKGVVSGFLATEETRVGKLAQRALAIVRPILLITGPTLLALDLLQYNLLSILLVRLIGGAVAGVATAVILDRTIWTALSAWLRAIVDDEVPADRDISDQGAALKILRWVTHIATIAAGVAVMLVVQDGDLAAMREWLSDELPFQDQVDGRKITWWGVLFGSAMIMLFLSSVSRVKLALECFVLPHTSLDGAVRYTISTLTGYAVAALGLYIGLVQMFDLSALGYIFAALSVGIGFGLQEIVSNFISGLILLFERPIKVGDQITVGGTEGRVVKINIRATRIQTLDNVSLLIPNKDFITQAVINSVYSDTIIRVKVPVGVAYGSDTALVRRLLFEVAQRHKQRVFNRPSEILFVGFGESSLDFEVRCWIKHVADRYVVASDLNFEIDAEFRKHGVEIPFPQRDLHLRSVDGIAASSLRGKAPALDVEAEGPPDGAPHADA